MFVDESSGFENLCLCREPAFQSAKQPRDGEKGARRGGVFFVIPRLNLRKRERA